MKAKTILPWYGSALCVLLLAGCNACSRRSADLAQQVPGTWKLETVGGKDPSSIEIQSWQVQFSQDGTWRFSGTVMAENQGTQMSGSGTWSLRGNDLQYTAGEAKGATSIEAGKDSLDFSSDPVIRVNGTNPVRTRYLRMASH
jgi:hypothetical protein